MSRPDSRERIAARIRQAQRDQQRREFFVTAAVLILGAQLVAGWALGWFAAEISVESSDGHWADREALAEGRDYTDSISLFMQYRIECDAGEAVLYRTTRIPWWNPLVWPSIALDDKWRIPYREASATAPPSGIPDVSCPTDPDAWARAEREAREYLEAL